MDFIIGRRNLMIGVALAVPALAGGRAAFGAADDGDVGRRLAALEKITGGRLGVYVKDTATGRSFGCRATERFAMGSTFKTLAAACVLARVEAGKERLDRRIAYGPGALVPYSPVTQKYAGREGMTLAELCEAAITRSDNAAGNLLLQNIGGPERLTRWLRAIGDRSTRLDRIEPELNQAKEGDARDTTTPRAMAETLGALLLGDVLSASNRERLAAWLVASKTGEVRLRAGLPETWRVGDKTGTTGNGSVADVAVAWPERPQPVLIAAYIGEATGPMKNLDTVFAEIGKLVAEKTG
ncbi:MAG: class A beta-lactamase [Shinella sp.]|nr:class A beta-lactamase [Shinella sp.]